MKRRSVLDSQSVKRGRKSCFFLFRRSLGQLGFGLIKMFLFILGVGGLSLACISGSQFLSSSPYFGLRNIVVTGVTDDVREEVVKLSGLKGGESLLRIDPAAIKGNIEVHPWIKSALLKKQFPHTLHIEAENEEPVAVVLLERMYLMDREGIIFKEVERDDTADFPVVTGLPTGDGKNGAWLKEVASLLSAFSSANTPISAREVSEIHVEADGALSIYFNQLPFKVFFGRDDFVRKIGSLRHVIEHLRATHRLHQARSIDLSSSDRAVVAFNGRVV